MSKNTSLAELMNYITIDTTSGSQLQMSGSIKQTSVTSALLKANSTGVIVNAVAGTDYLTSVGISNITATGTPDATTYLRGDGTWATVSGGGGSGTVTSVAALTLGTTGTDLSSTVATGTTTPVITLNVPDASATARGVVTTGTQTFGGLKTFKGTTASDDVTYSSELLTTGSGTNWTGTSFSAGYTHTVGSVVALTSALSITSTTYYKLTIVSSGSTAGWITVTFGGLSSTTVFTGTTNITFLTTSTGALTITPTTDFNGTITVSLKSYTQSNSLLSLQNSSATEVLSIRPFTTSIYAGSLSGRFATSLATYSTAFGASSQALITNGDSNTSFGYNSLGTNSNGVGNTAIGTNAMGNNTTPSYNVAIGSGALRYGSIITGNVAVGNLSLANTSTGSNNVSIGFATGQNVSTGGNNVYIGAYNSYSGTTGSNNIILGYEAGRYYGTSGFVAAPIINNSILLGHQTRPLADSQTNQIVIGYTTVGLGSNTTVIGNSSTVTTALYGRLLIGSTTDNGTNALQVTGSTKITGSIQATTTGTIGTTLSINGGVLTGNNIVSMRANSTGGQFRIERNDGSLCQYPFYVGANGNPASYYYATDGTTLRIVFQIDTPSYFYNKLAIGHADWTTASAITEMLEVNGNIKAVGKLIASGNASTNSAIILDNQTGASGTAQYYTDFTAGAATIGRIFRGNGLSGTVGNGLNIDNYDGFQVRLNQLGGSGGSFNIMGGNLGLGVTPSAWSLGKAFEIGYLGSAIWSNGLNDIQIMANTYYNAGYLYASTGTASRYYQDGGAHVWLQAPSGTAGTAISFTQAMTLDASGRLGVGTTSPSAKIHISGTGSGAWMKIERTDTGTNIIDFIQSGTRLGYMGYIGNDMSFNNATASNTIFYTSGTEAMRINAGSNVSIGTTTDNGIGKLQVAGNIYSEGHYIATGQFSAGASTATTFYTFSNVASNRAFIVTIRQSGASVNSAVGMVMTYGANVTAYNIGQDNTNPALYLTFSSSGLGIIMTTGAGYGTTTWEYTLTQIK